MSGGLEADLDLTDAVEAAARAYWEQISTDIPWERVVAINTGLAHDIRERVLPIVTAAAPIIATAALTHAHAELRAEVERLRAEQERHALANDGCVPGAAYRDLAAAHADLRTGIEALPTWRLVDGSPVVRRSDLRALLAESGEQPGDCGHPNHGASAHDCRPFRPAPVAPDKCPSCGSADRFVLRQACAQDAVDPDLWHRTRPAVAPDSADVLRARLRRLAAEWDERAAHNDDQGGEFWQGMTVKGRECSAELRAVVGQGAAADRATRANRSSFDLAMRPYRVDVRPSGQEGS